jgi:hypothetical protein
MKGEKIQLLRLLERSACKSHQVCMGIIVEVVKLEALYGFPFPAHSGCLVQNSARLLTSSLA